MIPPRNITIPKGRAMTSTTCHCPPRRAERPRRPSLLDRLAVQRQRRALARLPDAGLRDIGLTRAAALREARRPFWDV